MANNENGRYTLPIVMVILVYCICVVDEQAAVTDGIQELMARNENGRCTLAIYSYSYIHVLYMCS